VRFLDAEHCPSADELVAGHVALPDDRPTDRAFVRLNMISSADGGSAVAGLSGGLGNRIDHAVFGALRDHADGVLVGLGTVTAEQYGPPAQAHLQIYVVTSRPETAADEPLFASGRATLVLPEDADPAPAGVPDLRAGELGMVDLRAVMTALAGKVIVAEGGPTLAGSLAALGLIDEFFLTVAPRVVAGNSGRVAHGPDATPAEWLLEHGFVDDEGFLFLRYARH
jgi:riboflavin biosynthesis pyrimidine reductase